MKIFHIKNKKKESLFLPDNKGVISLFLCLILLVLIPIIFIMIESTRYSAMKAEIECVTDMAMDSVLAEYNRELLDRYNLLFVDTAYADETGSPDNTGDHLKEYMEYNLSPSDSLLSSGSRDLFGLSVESVDITRVSRATDDNGAVFKYMAISYMLEYYGYSYVESANDMVSQVSSSGLLDIDVSADLENSRDELNNLDYETEGSDSGEDFEDIYVEDPSLSINSISDSGFLSVICSDEVSGITTDLSYCPSFRDLVAGDGIYNEWPDYNDIADELLFNEYIMLHYGSYKFPKEGSVLGYETEYIISGTGSDTDNLESVAKKILFIRSGANALTYMSSPVLQGECASLATALTLIFPPAQPIVQTILSAAWIYAESVWDLRIIFNNGKLPLIKNQTEWNMTLEDAINNLGTLLSGGPCDYSNYTNGIGYRDYLRILLYLTGSDEKVKRTIDITEMDIRNITGNMSFKIDNCIASFSMQTVLTSSYGYEFLVQKDFGYW